MPSVHRTAARVVAGMLVALGCTGLAVTPATAAVPTAVVQAVNADAPASWAPAAGAGQQAPAAPVVAAPAPSASTVGSVLPDGIGGGTVLAWFMLTAIALAVAAIIVVGATGDRRED